MYSFYGGRKGQDFSIATVFSTRVEMETDLTKGWTSPIPVASYVMISYGLPSDPNYATYRDQDIEAYGVSYNSTLWQKIYNEDEDMTANGLRYQLIASLTGNTPRISIDKPITVLDADEDPDVDINSTNPDDVVVTFKLPQSQVITQTTTTPIDADQNPSVDMDVSNINQPILTFKLPQSQTFGNVQTIVASSNSLPEVSIDNTDINHPELIFKLPQAQALNVVASYTIQETADFTANLENGVSYIEEHYIGNVSSSDLFAITWVLLDGSSVSYWYFQDMTQIWSRIQVSGAAGNIIENIYNNEAGGPDNKAYSINYTNKLINDNLITDNKAIKTYSARLLEDLLSWGTYEDLMQ